MSFWDGYLDFQTTIDQGDVRAAVKSFARCKKNADKNGAAPGGERRVTDSDLCREIWTNPVLREACSREGLDWDWPSFGAVLGNFFRFCGRAVMAVLLFPFSIFVSFYAQYRLNRMIANMRPIKKPGAEAVPDEKKKTANDFLHDPRIQEQIRESSGSFTTNVYGEDQSLNSLYYGPIPHEITIAKCVTKSSDPVAFGMVSHEAGHAEQRIFLLGKIIVSIAAVAGLVVGAILFFFFPAAAIAAIILLAIAGSIMALMPLVTVFYEVDASKRGLANIVRCEVFTSEEDAAQAAYALQLAASTYLAGFLMSTLQLLALYPAWDKAKQPPETEPALL
ncbi:MAG: zinc metallopeptidase [Puniceicoccales bacterium]|jgi:Zn-dependent membrane protease YugP|nr:zinc metallopeptidase [Puniceicoccales bacterium]